jgi:hypothetical protein
MANSAPFSTGSVPLDQANRRSAMKAGGVHEEVSASGMAARLDGESMVSLSESTVQTKRKKKNWCLTEDKDTIKNPCSKRTVQ